jgi:hypothetical protein
MHEIFLSEANSHLAELFYVQEEQLHKCVLPSPSSYILNIKFVAFKHENYKLPWKCSKRRIFFKYKAACTMLIILLVINLFLTQILLIH